MFIPVVYRGAEDTFDISADLQELARTPVTVVSSGVKSILGNFKSTHSRINLIIESQY